ncbi:hypothetical protein NUW58_g1362 [Xylaria curta]|uniref:Uncharacterized protein n=1 Tax=Xylaria curta TaxID=42375 RepID=A0ACC1PM51_9PEZI|nr:hypothetical protein NUW58_g1362 [Xylaria curta]
MDPLSITLASVTLIGAIAKVGKTGASFLADVRNARSDIEAIIVEFDSIKVVITLIANEFQQSVDPVPTPLHEKIVGIINNCADLVADIDKSLASYGPTSAQKRLKWATSGKKDIAKARSGLSAHRVALELALEMLNMQVVKEIRDGTIELTSETRETKDQTSRILEGNRNIRDDVQRILQEISRLQALLPSERPNSIMLQRYLDELSNYVESVSDGSDRVKSNTESQGVSEERQMEEPRNENQERDDSGVLVGPQQNRISRKESIVQCNLANVGSTSASEIGKWPVRIIDKQGGENSTSARAYLLQVLDFGDDGIAREFVYTKEEDMLAYKAQLLDVIPRFRYISVGWPYTVNSGCGSLKVSSYLRSIYQIPQSFFELSISPQSSRGSLYTGASNTKIDAFASGLKEASAREASIGKTSKQCSLCYILRTVKKRTSPANTIWAIEPVAVYHSFDVDTFSSLWLTIHDTDETKYGTYDVLSTGKQTSNPHSYGYSLTAALEAQLLFLRLAEENWESYITYLEHSLSQTMEKVKPINVDERPRFYPLDMGADFDIGEKKAENAIRKFNDSVQGMFSTIWDSREQDGSLRQRAHHTKKRHSMGIREAHENTKRQLDAELEAYLCVDTVNIHDKQNLHHIQSQVQDTLLNLQLNLTVLRETKSHYQNLQDHVLPPGLIGDQAQIGMKEFLYNAGQIETNLAIKHRKLETLDHHVRDGISLCDGILQYHSLQVSKIFNERAKLSSENLERVMKRTEQETASMHIITIFTVIFLPATFVGTFLSIDTIWPSLDEADSDWFYPPRPFRYFIRICVALILVSTIIWVSLFFFSRQKKAREIKKLRKDEESGDGLKIIHAGLFRMGTHSMAKAYRVLGFTTFHALDEPFRAKWVQIEKAAEATWPSVPNARSRSPFKREDWDELWGEYDAVCDTSAPFTLELFRAYPDARVVIVQRDFDSWWPSFKSEILDNLFTSFFESQMFFAWHFVGFRAGHGEPFPFSNERNAHADIVKEKRKKLNVAISRTVALGIAGVVALGASWWFLI